MGSSIYELPVREQGKSVVYHCMLSPSGASISWCLVRGSRVLSGGLCPTEDIPRMLEALRVDLGVDGGSGDWLATTIH